MIFLYFVCFVILSYSFNTGVVFLFSFSNPSFLVCLCCLLNRKYCWWKCGNLGKLSSLPDWCSISTNIFARCFYGTMTSSLGKWPRRGNLTGSDAALTVWLVIIVQGLARCGLCWSQCGSFTCFKEVSHVSRTSYLCSSPRHHFLCYTFSLSWCKKPGMMCLPKSWQWLWMDFSTLMVHERAFALKDASTWTTMGAEWVQIQQF